jgi:hypothetical protein
MSPKRSVHFPEPPFTSCLHPLNHPEYWVMRYFEDHIVCCSACVEPFRFLCREGLSHAGSIDSYVQSSGNRFYSTANQRVCLEIPPQFQAVRVLLKTMEERFPQERFRQDHRRSTGFYENGRKSTKQKSESQHEKGHYNRRGQDKHRVGCAGYSAEVRQPLRKKYVYIWR